MVEACIAGHLNVRNARAAPRSGRRSVRSVHLAPHLAARLRRRPSCPGSISLGQASRPLDPGRWLVPVSVYGWNFTPTPHHVTIGSKVRRAFCLRFIGA